VLRVRPGVSTMLGIQDSSAHPCRHTNKSSAPQLRQYLTVNGYVFL
jgi:hypothetical protein